LGKPYAVGAMSMAVLIDRDGKITAMHVDVLSESDSEKELESRLRMN
jgi:hypothetical protein